MVSNVNSIITSGDLGGGLIPTEYATQIIQDAPKSSVSLTRMRQIRMSTRTRTQPVLDSCLLYTSPSRSPTGWAAIPASSRPRR